MTSSQAQISRSLESAGLPQPVRMHLQALFSVVVDEIGAGNIVSLFLLGSTARNELAYRITEKGMDVFGDYEFIVIVRRQPPGSVVERLRARLDELSAGWGIRSPLFSIDFGISTLAKFRLTPRTLWAFEVKSFALTVSGENVLDRLPDVTADNLDKGNLNELVIVRLWNMLIHINDGFVVGDNSDYENFTVKLFYCRNILDVLTILLPNRGLLAGGYRERNRLFQEMTLEDHWRRLAPVVDKATRLKLDLDDAIDLAEARQGFLDGYTLLLNELLGADGDPERLPDIESLRRSDIFREQPVRRLRRWWIEFELFRRYYGGRLTCLDRFLGETLRAHLTLCLLHLHRAIAGEAEVRDAEMEKAIERFAAIANKPIAGNGTFIDDFRMLRRELLSFMGIWLYARMNFDKDDMLKLFAWREQP